MGIADRDHEHASSSSGPAAGSPTATSPLDQSNAAPGASGSGSGATTAAAIANDDQIEADYSTDDDGFDASTTNTYLTSIASDIRRGVEENGRLYAAYGMHKTYLPIDDGELDRNDLQHCKFTLMLEGKLFLAPIVAKPQNILDLGTGSGIWAIDIADAYPSAAVIGVDLAPVQPSIVPPNLTFEIDDIEKDWLWGEDQFDLIHGRELIMAIRDWPRLVRQAYTCLKPGGYIQLSGSLPDFQADDGTLPPDAAYLEMSRIYFDMSARIGASGREVQHWKRYLEDAGYVDVVQHVVKIPTNPWPKDSRLKKIGAFELAHFRDGIANVFARGYEDILGGDPVYFQVLLARARQEVMNRGMHSWVPFYYVWGRKPQ
ncbi:S-adenosyl-L-methionine-dependent methyltransferase [Podospora appendiculata]|uniref:S-adenosyl-L-methionine-dependent methyltransferase n=1 Tax=Podospora appendiculata TaxID=314037 RepID=A0AAE1C8H9_9PEZI|nr:S-adenosyl-L-methionine-dependent methyltransferase [Podospora appendiculata]